ncbi:MAG TPA: DUF2934 domain-containing protein [Candidatus Sulfotelmatobacter sp.]|nr:DUF2934 domain-containing protein [Candidatus Sulfotelmatobacter sp.]
MAKPRVPKNVSQNPATTGAASPSTELSTSGNGAAINAESATKSIRKPTIVKSETRPNLVPINLEDEIRRLAYLMAERRGFEPGHEAEDWLTAEREVRQRYHQHSA